MFLKCPALGFKARDLHVGNYETSEDKQRFLQIDKKPTKDDQVRAFLDKVEKVNRTIQSEIRTIPEAERPKVIMESLSEFFELLQDINNPLSILLNVPRANPASKQRRSWL